jgi:hypothetical protein
MIAPTNVTDERLGGLGARVDLCSSAPTRPPAVTSGSAMLRLAIET